MSRTHRKNRLDHYDKKWFKEAVEAVKNGNPTLWELSTYRYYLYKYKRDMKYRLHTLPKSFRKEVNKHRRAKDKQEVYKAITINGYEELCSNWNCKDNESWGYF